MIGVRALTGAATADVLDDVARLRIEVFRDWPYLYRGSLEYERGYLAPYAESDSAVIVVARDGDRIVGAATGTAMEDHASEFRAALELAEIAPGDAFYCAESVLHPDYRGRGLGHRFFDLREQHARALGRKWSVFCSVIRPDDHPLRPADYRPLAPFWKKRGYWPVAGALAHFSWRDVDQTAETEKPLQLWTRALR